ncbi:MAG: hypothetical protein ACK4ND_05045, partial [Cytophagaceae bacterium]
LFTTLFISESVAQKVLTIRNTETGKTRTLKPGRKLQLQTKHSGIFIKATIESIKDSVITFYTPDEDDQLLRDYKLSEIKAIQKPTTFHKVSYFTGSLLLVGGAYYAILANHISEGSPYDDSPARYRAIGILALGVAITPFLIKPKTYEIGQKYELIIEDR